MLHFPCWTTWGAKHRQLYLNALFKREGVPVRDLGAAMNYVGSELKRAVLVGPQSAPVVHRGSSRAPSENVSAARRAGLRDACILHLTRKVPKLYTADWVVRRMLASATDVLTCDRNASSERRGAAGAVERRALRARLPKPLPSGKYELGKVLCADEPPPCGLQPWARAGAGVRGSGSSSATRRATSSAS